jgi:hypothetical protein
MKQHSAHFKWRESARGTRVAPAVVVLVVVAVVSTYTRANQHADVCGQQDTSSLVNIRGFKIQRSAAWRYLAQLQAPY